MCSFYPFYKEGKSILPSSADPSEATVEVVDQVNSSWLKVKYKGRESYISSLPRFVKYENGQASSRLSPPRGTEHIAESHLAVSSFINRLGVTFLVY
jgi:hypothetical protein